MRISDSTFFEDTNESKFFREYDGLWTLEIAIEMNDLHRGKMNCIVRKFGGPEAWFDTRLMVDSQHKMIYFFEPTQVDLRNRFFSQGDDELRIGMKQIRKRKFFPHFFASFKHLRNTILAKFYIGWSSRNDFTAMDCTNIHERAFSQAVKGGLSVFLPLCVIHKITDYLNPWACMVDNTYGDSRAWSRWLSIYPL